MANTDENSSDHRKLAFIIGNNSYYRSENSLKHSIQTTNELSDLLRKIGFHVTTACDLEKSDMTTSIINFSKTIQDGDLVLFYFSGHGYQVKDTNYLIPINDAWIKIDRDVEDFGIHFNRVLRRVLEKNASYVNIFILDCCRPYMTNDSTASSSLLNSKGLCAIELTDGAFIQFSCAADETASDNLFIKHLLKNITKENINIHDVFQRIVNGVYEESNQQQRPLSINGLKQHQDVYLNYVTSPAPDKPKSIIWDEPEPDKKESILKTQAEFKACYDSFPNIDDIIDPENEDIKKAEEFTRSILSEPPSGEVDKMDTVCHVINQLFENENQQCLFFDSSQGVNLYNTFGNLTDLSFEYTPFILKLESIDELSNEGNIDDQEHDLQVVTTLNRAIQENQSSPVIDDIIQRLAAAHNTDRKKIVLKSVYLSSINIVYAVEGVTTITTKDLEELQTRMKSQFKQPITIKIHPLLSRPTFDVALFDKLGNKSFERETGTFNIGPAGRTKQYIQPTGWNRQGWKVLGRYASDKWLDPFRDPENWYRAFHGTKNAQTKDFGDSNIEIDSENVCLHAAFSIFKKGFGVARVAAYGPGVYCSPKPTFVDGGYAGIARIDTKLGKKSFKIMLQLAVNPDGVRFADDDIWVVEKPENIRTYGLLIKEVHSN